MGHVERHSSREQDQSRPELLAEVMEMHASTPACRPRTGPCSRRAPFVMFELLNARGFRGRRRAEMSIALEFRLTALALLTAAQGGRGFTRPGSETGLDWVHADLVRCAAEEPLVEREDQAVFDVDSFQRRLLAVTEMQGQA